MKSLMVTPGSSQMPSSSHGDVGPTPSRMVQGTPKEQAPKIRPRNPNRTGRHHSISDGKYTMNRTGYSICQAFNEGKCEGSSPGGWCPTSWDTVHQCARCLGQHPAVRCPCDSMPQPIILLKNKGRGKGGGGHGKGKRSKGKSAQY